MYKKPYMFHVDNSVSLVIHVHHELIPQYIP